MSAVEWSEISPRAKKVTTSNAPSTPTQQHRECPPPTPHHLQGYFTMLLLCKGTELLLLCKGTHQKFRCEFKIYDEALTSDEVLERIEEEEAQNKEKMRRKKGRVVDKKSDDENQV